METRGRPKTNTEPKKSVLLPLPLSVYEFYSEQARLEDRSVSFVLLRALRECAEGRIPESR